jgi:hypothetical protein
MSVLDEVSAVMALETLGICSRGSPSLMPTVLSHPITAELLRIVTGSLRDGSLPTRLCVPLLRVVSDLQLPREGIGEGLLAATLHHIRHELPSCDAAALTRLVKT